MNYIVDLILIVIVAVCAIVAAKKGFLSVIIGFCSLLLSAVIAFSVSTVAADFVFDNFVGEYVSTKIVEEVKDSGASNAQDVVLPRYVDRYLGDSAHSVKSNILSSVNTNAEEISEGITENAVKPAVLPLITLILFFIVFIALQFLFKFFKKLSKFVNKIPLVGSLNSFFGGIAGILEGVILIIIICTIISVIVKYTENGFLIFKPEVLNNTYIYKSIISHNFIGAL